MLENYKERISQKAIENVSDRGAAKPGRVYYI
jgi:hypothetical protein